MNVNPSYEIKQISKKESITQIYKSGDDISKYIDYKPKYLNLKKILKTNLKWFKKIDEEESLAVLVLRGESDE